MATRDSRLSLRLSESDRQLSSKTRVGRQRLSRRLHHVTGGDLFAPRVAAYGPVPAPHGRAAHSLTGRSIRSRFSYFTSTSYLTKHFRAASTCESSPSAAFI